MLIPLYSNFLYTVECFPDVMLIYTSFKGDLWIINLKLYLQLQLRLLPEVYSLIAL